MILTCSTRLRELFSTSMRIRENEHHEIRDGSAIVGRIADSFLSSLLIRAPSSASYTVHLLRMVV